MVQDKEALKGGVGTGKEEVVMNIRKFYPGTFLDRFFRNRIGVSFVLFFEVTSRPVSFFVGLSELHPTV